VLTASSTRATANTNTTVLKKLVCPILENGVEVYKAETQEVIRRFLTDGLRSREITDSYEQQPDSNKLQLASGD
jgi:hypothetical protein